MATCLRAARIARPLLPAVIEERFEQALDLEWPIEGLEPLSFVLGRLMEPLSSPSRAPRPRRSRPARAAASRHARRARALAAVAGADAGCAHPPYPGAAGPRIASSSRCDRSRRRGRRPDAGARPSVFAAHAPVAVTRSDFHADGAAHGADGRGAMWIAGGGRLVGAGRVCDEAFDPGSRLGFGRSRLVPSHGGTEARRNIQDLMTSVSLCLRGPRKRTKRRIHPLSRCADSGFPFPHASASNRADPCVWPRIARR